MLVKVIVVLAAGLYLLPTVVALSRRHDQLARIVPINVLLGWTMVGWVIALHIAVSEPHGPMVRAPYFGTPRGYLPPWDVSDIGGPRVPVVASGDDNDDGGE